MNTNTRKRIAKFFINELNTKLSNIVVIKDEDTNEYFLFNRYYIREVNPGFFEVSFTFNDQRHTFHSLKNAMCFCVFDKANKFSETTRIKSLDIQLASVDVSIFQLKKLIKKTKDLESKMIFIAKLSEEIFRKKTMQAQLVKFIDTAKYWQSSKFKEENTNK